MIRNRNDNLRIHYYTSTGTLSGSDDDDKREQKG